jgi:16S rRNA processing protein RimM
MSHRRRARVVLGTIVGAHGVRGQLRIRPFTAEPQAIAAYGPVETEDGRMLELSDIRPAPKGLVLARAAGIGDRDAAKALAGQSFSVARARLPEPAETDEYYQADLIGLGAVDPEGKALGMVVAVHDFGAGPLIELAAADGSSRMLPFTRAVALAVDLEAGRIVLAPPESEPNA